MLLKSPPSFFKPRTVPINSKRGRLMALSGATFVFETTKALDLTHFGKHSCNTQRFHRHLRTRPQRHEEKCRQVFLLSAAVSIFFKPFVTSAYKGSPRGSSQSSPAVHRSCSNTLVLMINGDKNLSGSKRVATLDRKLRLVKDK